MPLNVSYKNRIGYYTETQKLGDQVYKYKIWFCHANCLCAMMYFWTEDQNGEKVSLVKPVGFFSDLAHLKRCDKNIFENCSNFHFKAQELNTELWNMIKYMTTTLHIKVTIE